MALSEEAVGAGHPSTYDEAPKHDKTRPFELSGEAFGEEQTPGRVAVRGALDLVKFDPNDEREEVPTQE